MIIVSPFCVGAMINGCLRAVLVWSCSWVSSPCGEALLGALVQKRTQPELILMYQPSHIFRDTNLEC